MPHILSMSVNPDTELRDRSCAPCNQSTLAISCCGLCAFWVGGNALFCFILQGNAPRIAEVLNLRQMKLCCLSLHAQACEDTWSDVLTLLMQGE